MELDVWSAVEDGAHRTLERNGLMLVTAFFLLNLASSLMQPQQSGGLATGVAGVNPVISGVLGIVVALVSVAVTIVALRVFVTDETEIIPDKALKWNMGNALLHMVIGGIVFGIAVAVGLILLIVPGIYLALALFFWTVYVAVEDKGFYEAMKSSWELTEGHKWRLLGLFLVLGIVNLALMAPGMVLAVAGMQFVGVVVLQALSALGVVFSLAVEARAYTRLSG